MTNDGKYDEDSDPLLVRPFVLGDYDRSAAEPSRLTWPVNATHEVRSHRARAHAEPPTEVLFSPTEPVRFDRRRLLVLAATGAAVLVGAAVVSLAAMRPDDRPPATALQDPPPLAIGGPAADTPSPLSSAAAASLAASADHRAVPPTSAPAGVDAPGAVPTSPAATTAEVPAIAASSSTAPGAITSPPALVAPSPPSGRTGRIRGQNGVCLDGATATEGAVVEVTGCAGRTAQIWTLATDGTMRVLEMCALAAGDGTIHTSKCDGRSTEQWSISGQRLINTSTATCLTDPFGGGRPGAAVILTRCGGSATQRWSLPN